MRQSLRHVPAPVGFTDRVMSRIAERDRRVPQPVRRGALLRGRPYAAWWAGVAAALVVAVSGGNALHVRHQRQAQEAAAVQAQLDVAMQLTSHALGQVQTGLDRSPAGKFARVWNGTGQ